MHGFGLVFLSTDELFDERGKGSFVMHEIHSKLLWIGNAFDIRQPRGLFDVGIRAVIDVAYEEPPAQLPRQLIYCRFPLNDGGGNDPQVVLQSLLTVTDLLSFKIPTMVACSGGYVPVTDGRCICFGTSSRARSERDRFENLEDSITGAETRSVGGPARC